MTETGLAIRGNKSFEELKKLTDHGAEYWSARELQPLLGYEQWRRFENAIKKAITACKQSGNNPDHHFAGAGKMIEIGKGGGKRCENFANKHQKNLGLSPAPQSRRAFRTRCSVSFTMRGTRDCMEDLAAKPSNPAKESLQKNKFLTVWEQRNWLPISFE